MTLKEFKRLMLRNRWLLIIIPLVTAVSVFFFTSLQEQKYTSSTTIFTGIASGYRIAGDNNEGFRIGAENAFGNFTSLIEARDTKQEVIFNLLASHLMLPKSDPKVLSKENYDRLQELIPASLKKKLVAGTIERTAANIDAYFKSSNKNEIYRLVNSNDPVYSYAALENVEASREGASEMVKLEYASNDPAVSQHTLEFLLDVFTRKHKELFAGQTESVINFFDSAKQNAYERLKEAEQKLLEFNKANHIVNYEDQIATTSAEKAALADRAYNLEMEYAGAFANLKTVEESLKKRGVVNMHNQEIGRIRNQLAKVTSEIAEVESLVKNNSSDTNASSKLARLKQEESALTGQLKESINKLYADSHYASGASTEGLLDEWVRNSILVEQIKSQLNLLQKQQANFAGEYDKLVPLGAEVRKIRREIEVAEQEYMFQMQGLKQSMLTQQNIELASQLKVIDPPNMPSTSSSALMVPVLVVLGAIGSLFMTGTGVVAKGLLDTSLKTPAFVSKITNLPVIGVLLGKRTESYNPLAEKAEEQLAKQLLLKYHQKKGLKSPFLVGVLSSHTGEGKSTVCDTLAIHLQNLGVDTLVLYPENHIGTIDVTPGTSLYSPLNGITSNVSIAELSGKNMLNYSIVLVEFPAVLDEAYPVSLLKDLDLALLTIKANRKWLSADKNVFASIKSLTDSSIEIVLNGAAPEDVEEFVGATNMKNEGTVKRDNTKVLNPESMNKTRWEGEAAVINS